MDGRNGNSDNSCECRPENILRKIKAANGEEVDITEEVEKELQIEI